MNKFFLYVVLIILYLGLARILSPNEAGVEYLQNERGFSGLVKSNFSTIILTDTHATGFLIKTYYQKYRIINGYEIVDEVIVRTSKEFAIRNLPHMGLSIYRKYDNKEEFLPLPPGSLYLGNREFGDWKLTKKGNVIWQFNNMFKNFPRYLGWGDFVPDSNFYQLMRSSVGQNKPFYGPNREFGPDGKITQDNFPQFFQQNRKKKLDFKALLIQYFKENF
jgi:hypothetical protein